jgi:ribosomal protein L32
MVPNLVSILSEVFLFFQYVAFFPQKRYSSGIMTVRMRHTRAHTANRRSHHALTGAPITLEEGSKTPRLRHRVSLTTGTYRGKKVIDIVKKVEKKQKK